MPSETPPRRKQHDDDDDDDDDDVVDDDGEYDDGGEGGKKGGGSIASTRGAGRLGHRRASRHATLLSLAARARRACAPWRASSSSSLSSRVMYRCLRAMISVRS